MAQSIVKLKYSEVNVGEEQAELTSKNNAKNNRSYTQSKWSTIFSKNRMKIICTGFVLVSIMAGSMAFIISSKSSLNNERLDENDSVDTMDFNNGNEVEGFIPSNDKDNTDNGLPQLRSYTGPEKRRSPDSLGRMNIYINKNNRNSYQRHRFPVARYDRQRFPLPGPFLSFMPWVPIFADRLTKQTIIISPSGVFIIPPVINMYGQMFSIAQLIATGYASLVSSGGSLNANFDMLRYFQPFPLIGPGIPVINPLTGIFNGGVRGNFGSFPKAKNYRGQSQMYYPQESEENEEEGENYNYQQEREDYNYRPQYNQKKYYKKPTKSTKYIKTITTTTTTTTATTTTKKDEPPNQTTSTTSTSSITTPSDCRGDQPARTPYILKPFQNTFKNPPIMEPISTDCRKDGHCILSYSVDVYDTRLRVFDEVIPECAAKEGTIFITYNGSVPGRTFLEPVGHESIVRFNNKIGNFFKQTFSPCNGSRSGRPISIHHHGAASLSPYDGWAEDETCFGETKEYVYPNNRPATEWYHDHALHITADNAYLGLAGLYITTSKTKEGGCGEFWNLENLEEKHFIFQDKVLDSECQLFIDVPGFDHISFYGDINLVSGIPFPVVNLDPKWYHFRLLNAAVSRPWLLKVKDAVFNDIGQQICKVIASDAGFRKSPITFPSAGLLIGVAERYELVCDFTTLKGQTLYLWNDKDEDFMKDVPYFCYSHYLAKIEVSSVTLTDPPAFNELITTPFPEKPVERVLTDSDIAAAMQMAQDGKFHRRMHFDRGNGHWVINGETWDTFKIAAEDVGQNTWELWFFVTGGGWFHPVHVHLVDFYILIREGDGGLHEYEKLAPKDVLYLGPSQKLYVLIRFGPHKGDYMFHCHNLIHEDDDMMRAFRVNSTKFGLNAPTAAQFTRNALTNIIYDSFEYSDPTLPAVSAKPTALMPTYDTAYKHLILNKNLYRIFYPLQPDDDILDGGTNPWKSTWCPLPNTNS